jgi:hypothetical protein
MHRDQSTFEGKVVCELISLCDVPHPYGQLQVNLYMQDKTCPKAWDIILCERRKFGLLCHYGHKDVNHLLALNKQTNK